MTRKQLSVAAAFAFTALTAFASAEDLDRKFNQAKDEFERSQANFTYFVFGGMALVLILAIAIIVASRRQRAKMKSWNFDWYKQEFPNLVQGGQVACYKCGGKDIGIERLMNHMYMRRHVCRTCGNALYYSPEQ